MNTRESRVSILGLKVSFPELRVCIPKSGLDKDAVLRSVALDIFMLRIRRSTLARQSEVDQNLYENIKIASVSPVNAILTTQ